MNKKLEKKFVCLLFNRDKKFPTELTKIILEIFHCTIFLTLFSEHILAIQEDAFFKIKKKKKSLVRRAHLKNALGSLGGTGCGSGLLLLNSMSWTGELGMGSRRVGCPLPTPLDSRALRLGTLTNLFVGDLSFFFFCCIKNNTCEDIPYMRINKKK